MALTNSLKNFCKKYVLFQEPEDTEDFILREHNEGARSEEDAREREHKEPALDLNEGKHAANDNIRIDHNPAIRKKNQKYLLQNSAEKAGQENGRNMNDHAEGCLNAEVSQGGSEKRHGNEISSCLKDNLEYMKKRFSVPVNSDVVIREFSIPFGNKSIPAFIIYFDGLVDSKVIDDNLLEALMWLPKINAEFEECTDVASFIRKRLLPLHQLLETTTYDNLIDEVNFGGVGLFVDGLNIAFHADVKGFEHRSVDRPNTELVIRGPQEGFTENIRTNTGMLRRRLKDEDLIVESVTVGERSKTPCAIIYIKDIANDFLVQEVIRRVKSIKIDYLNDSGELEQLIEDSPFAPLPQIIATERPDKIARYLSEGKVAIAVNGSPFVLAVPATFYELIHASEDMYLRFPYANLIRIVRLLGLMLALLLPGMYIAITNYHIEMIPTGLLIAIEASREKVPFPSVIEILIMEISFELIREAGIRIPGPIGPTLGIIGALILGQAAVAANIVSPILIIIVAVTGIGSFAFPDYSLSFGFRSTRFVYIFLGAVSGFLGISVGLFIHGLWIVNTKSFGVPYLAPFAPRTEDRMVNNVTRAPIWKMENRPDYMNPKDITRQPSISRGWTRKRPEEYADRTGRTGHGQERQKGDGMGEE